ncbi:MAG: cytochrome c-type biogenesis protein CcmH [Nannocystaceae bacterium]
MRLVPPSEAETITRELASELMSPYCPGRTIASCTSPQARRLEAYIGEQAETGRSQVEIKQDLLLRFGEEKLGSDDNAVVVFGTALVALLAAAGILRFVRRRLSVSRDRARPPSDRTPKPDPARGSAPTQAEIDRLDDDLDQVDDF